jgi:hypothetical protein
MKISMVTCSALVLGTWLSAQQMTPVIQVLNQKNHPISQVRIHVGQGAKLWWSGQTNTKGQIPSFPLTLGGFNQEKVWFSFWHPDVPKAETQRFSIDELKKDTLQFLLQAFIPQPRMASNHNHPMEGYRGETLSHVEKETMSGAAPRGRSVAMSDAEVHDVPSTTTASAPTPSPGMLTAAEVNDLAKWSTFSNLLEGPFASFSKEWALYPKVRITAEVQNSERFPLVDVPVSLIDPSGEVVWAARTDNTGRAELWANVFKQGTEIPNGFRLIAGDGWDSQLLPKVVLSGQGINRIVLPKSCVASRKVDVAFVVDATGSMGDELNYLTTELNHVMTRVAKKLQGLEFRTGAVVYRDFGDQYVTRHQPLGTSAEAQKFLAEQRAGGGGDFPEAVQEGLAIGLDSMGWAEEARAKIMFLVLDAPPHQTEEVKLRIQQQVRNAAARGIRIIPLACSGINKSTEFFLRSLALISGGTYTALTDESGVGGTHLKPSGDKINPQKMNDLLVKIIERYTYRNDCRENNQQEEDNQQVEVTHIESLLKHLDSLAIAPDPKLSFEWRLFPNPTRGPFTIETKKQSGNISILDVNGRLIMEKEGIDPGRHPFDFSPYSRGIYFVVFQNNQVKKCLKFILT